jgi:hypothetical protein
MLGLSSILDLIILYFFARPVVFLMADKGILTRRNVGATDPNARVTAGAKA